MGIHDWLDRCMIKLQQWSRTRRVNSKKLIDEIHNKLRELQRKPSAIYDRNEELGLKQLLEETWNMEEEYWRQKSRV